MYIIILLYSPGAATTINCQLNSVSSDAPVAQWLGTTASKRRVRSSSVVLAVIFFIIFFRVFSAIFSRI